MSMNLVWWCFAGALLLNAAVGLRFVTTRAGSADSFLAALLIGTTGVGLTLGLGEALEQMRAIDLALALALLAAVLGVAFARHAPFAHARSTQKARDDG